MVIAPRQVHLLARDIVIWSIHYCLASYSTGITAALMIARMSLRCVAVGLQGGSYCSTRHAYVSVPATIARYLLSICGCLCTTEICRQNATGRAILVIGDAVGHDVLVCRVCSMLIAFAMGRAGLIALCLRSSRCCLVVLAHLTHVQSVLHRI